MTGSGMAAEAAPERYRKDGERMSAQLVNALNHAVRREMLRLLNKPGAAMTATELSRWIRASPKSLPHHLQVLKAVNAVEIHCERTPVRGSKEKVYASLVSTHARACQILIDTKEEDISIRRGR